MLRRVLVIVSCLALCLGLSSPARADKHCKTYDDNAGSCKADSGDGSNGDNHSDPRKGPAPAHCVDSIFASPPRAVPCSGPLGDWSNDYQCFLKLYDGEPTDIRLSRRFHCYSPPYAGSVDLFVVNIIYGGPQVDPEAVARDVVVSLQLHAIKMGLAPRGGSTGLVQLPVWMWAADPDARTWARLLHRRPSRA